MIYLWVFGDLERNDEKMAIETTTSVDVKTLTPFKRFIMTLGILPTSYLESMTYAELVMWFCNFLQNEVIPAVNNNAEAVKEIQNWINTLDLQDEVDHKLDEMVESGQLQEIISDYLNSKAIFGYDNVEALKEATNFIDGSYAQTLGYYAKNDGGGALYKIRKITNEDIVDESFIIALNDESLIAELIVDDIINIKQLGAYGDGTHDDYNVIAKAINYIDSKQIIEIQPPSSGRRFATTPKLYFPTAKYKINSKLSFDENTRYYNIDGGDSFIESDNNNVIFYFSSVSGTKCNIKNFIFNGVETAIEYNASNNDVSFITIDNCKFIGTTNDAIKYQNQSSMLKISNCIFSWCYHIINKIKGDNVEFNNCWFSEYEAEEDNHSSFILLSGENKFINCFFIPNGEYKTGVNQSTYSNLSWIQAGDDSVAQEVKILIDRCRFSAEPNSKTIINWKAKTDNSNVPVKSYIRIENCFGLACQLGGCIVKAWHLPLQYIVKDSEITRETDTFIKLDDSLNVQTEIDGSVNGGNRAWYMYDYAFTNIKTQTTTAWDSIPSSIASLVRYSDFDVPMPINDTNKKVRYYLGDVTTSTFRFFKKIFLVKGFYSPNNQGWSLTSFCGLLIFDAVNSSVESSNSIRVKYVPLAEYLGGNSATTTTDITITPSFNNGTNVIELSGHGSLYIDLEVSGNVYDISGSYISIKEI